MTVQIDDKIYRGTGTEIMERLRQMYGEPEEYPDTETYIWQVRANFMRTTGLECDLPEEGVEEQARALIAVLAKTEALRVLEDG